MLFIIGALGVKCWVILTSTQYLSRSLNISYNPFPMQLVHAFIIVFLLAYIFGERKSMFFAKLSPSQPANIQLSWAEIALISQLS